MSNKVSYTQTVTGTWAADSAGINIDLDRTGLITRMDFTVEVTPSLTLTAANQPDGLFRLPQNLRVEGGSHTYFNLPADDACEGGVLLHYLNQADGLGLGHTDGRIAAPQRTYTPVNFVYHCGSRPRDIWGRDNRYDLSAFIPAVQETQLKAVWITSGNDVMDDSVTISSAVMRVTLHMFQGTEAEARAEMARQGVQGFQDAPNGLVPAWITEVYPHTATAPDYSAERDVPLGGFLKRIAIVEQDDTATRSVRASDQVTGIALKLVYETKAIWKCFADSVMARLPAGSNIEENDGAADFQLNAPRGVFILDCRPFVNSTPDAGLDLRGFTTGAWKLGLTITTYTSGDDSLILYERYVPNIQPRLM